MLNVVYNDDDEGNVNVNNNNIKYTYSNIKMYIYRVFSPLSYSVIQQQHFIWFSNIFHVQTHMCMICMSGLCL